MTSISKEIIPCVPIEIGQAYLESFISRKMGTGFMFTVVGLGFNVTETRQFVRCYEANDYIRHVETESMCYLIFLNRDDGTSTKLSEAEIDLISAFEQDPDEYDKFIQYAYGVFHGHPADKGPEIEPAK
jgi:hypothetical protein